MLFPVDPDGTINPDNQQSLTGSAALDSADAIVMLTRFRNWPEADMKHFVDAYRRGVPIVALRTSTHAFQIKDGPYKDFTNFGKRVLGEEWVSHWGNHKTEATKGNNEASAKNDPILRGVTDVFGDSDVYEAHPPADAKVLIRGQVLKGMNPSDPPAKYSKKANNGCYSTNVTNVSAAGSTFDGTEPNNGFRKGVDPTPDADCRSGNDPCG